MDFTLVQYVQQQYLKTHSDALSFPYQLEFSSNDRSEDKISKNGIVYARNQKEANKFIDYVSTNTISSLEHNASKDWYGTKFKYDKSLKVRTAQITSTLFGVRNLRSNLQKGFFIGGIKPLTLFGIVQSNVSNSIRKFLNYKSEEQALTENSRSTAFLIFLVGLVFASLSFFSIVFVSISTGSIFNIANYIALIIFTLCFSVLRALWHILWGKRMGADINE